MGELKVDFSDFGQDRYLEPVATRLVLALPVTKFRPEAMRVTERKSGSGVWFEVETFNPRLELWIDQKSHPTEEVAINDAKGWYPDPEEVRPTQGREAKAKPRSSGPGF